MSLQAIGGRRGRGMRLGIAVMALGAVIIAGCAGDKDKELKYVETPVDELYNKAVDALSVKRFQEAAKRFDEVERQHPYSVWARRAMLMSAYCYYRSNKYDDAILAAKRFITLHPGNRDVAYAYYLVGVSYYEQISDVGRDQKMTEEALKSLREVVRRFPNSDYARDARLKVDMTLDHLAGKEMAVGRWYLRRNQPLAAINRFTNVVRDYQTTTHVPEALLRLTEAYLTMGVYNEAKATAAVLGYNFPGSKWYEDAYDLLKNRNLKPEGSGDIKTVEADRKKQNKQPAPRPDPKAASALAPAPSFAAAGNGADAVETAEVADAAKAAGDTGESAEDAAAAEEASEESEEDAAEAAGEAADEAVEAAGEAAETAGEAAEEAVEEAEAATEEAVEAAEAAADEAAEETGEAAEAAGEAAEEADQAAEDAVGDDSETAGNEAEDESEAADQAEDAEDSADTSDPGEDEEDTDGEG